VRTHFRIGRMSLIGWSYLGAMVAHYALRHPEHVTLLVQVDPIPPRRDPYTAQDNAERRRRADDAAYERLQAMQREGLPQKDPVAYCRASNGFYGPLQFADPRAYARQKADPCVYRTEWPDNLMLVFAKAPFGQPYDWRREIARLRVPTLIVHGDKDPIPLAGSREWAARPNARLLVIPDAGHPPFIERPDLFFPAVDDFLRGRWPKMAAVIADR
jgi:pimeloyl-ACP methyl ester carboxylesterase